MPCDLPTVPLTSTGRSKVHVFVLGQPLDLLCSAHACKLPSLQCMLLLYITFTLCLVCLEQWFLTFSLRCPL